MTPTAAPTRTGATGAGRAKYARSRPPSSTRLPTTSKTVSAGPTAKGKALLGLLNGQLCVEG